MLNKELGRSPDRLFRELDVDIVKEVEQRLLDVLSCLILGGTLRMAAGYSVNAGQPPVLRHPVRDVEFSGHLESRRPIDGFFNSVPIV